MSTNRSRRIDPDTAEQLLGGAVVGTSAGQAPLAGHTALAGLLAAAAACPVAEDAELPGEQAALAAFREARRNPAHETRRRAMASTAPTRAFSLKALLAGFAVTAIGGVAVAVVAGTGALPVALGGSPASDTSPAAQSPATGPSTARVSPGATTNPDTDPTTGGGGVSTPKPSGTGAARSSANPVRPGSPTGQASPGQDGSGRPDVPAKDQATLQLVRLCQTLSEREAAGGKVRLLLTEPQLAPLVGMAGGVDRVDVFCKAAVAKAKQGGDQGGGGQGTDPTAAPSADRMKTLPPGGLAVSNSGSTVLLGGAVVR